MGYVNPHTIRHLSYCKSLYFHALEHSYSESVLDRAIATLNFDNAIEMFLYALIDYLGAKVPKENFDSLLSVFKDKIADMKISFDLSFLHEVEIRNLHRARNDVQHHGIIPSIDDLERYKTVTYEVLSNLSKPILGLEFEEIWLGDLIKDNLVKGLYKKAEEAYLSANYEDALVYVAGAFERAKNLEQGRIYGSGIMLAFLLTKTDNLTDKLVNEIEILKLRLDYKKYQKYRDIFDRSLEPFTTISSNTPKTLDGIFGEMGKLIASSITKWSSTDTDKVELKKSTVFCLAFVLDSLLKWEAVPRKGLWE